MIKIEDFKEGGSKRKYITHTGVLPEIDGDVLSDEQKQKLIEKCYTMCDGYIAHDIAQPGVDENETGETTEETTGETTENENETGKSGEEAQEPTSNPADGDGEVSTENDTRSE